tara:strand:+ start:884 stop:1798 length:915 start_codon:yes stop_codon:yes gene_type:complete
MAITLNGSTGVTTTGLTSNGIDDNATSTAITIDSSENVLIGRTSTADTAVGATLRPDGFVQSTRDGNIAADFNRNTSDGDIVRFSKGSSPVGSIGAYGNSGVYIAAPTSGGSALIFNDNAPILYPAKNNSGTIAVADNAIDLGASGVRFKDLYLSGGVLLGGTGAANKLDDYEEGLWTPTFVGSSSESGQSYATQDGDYTKIGNMVHCRFTITMTAGGTFSGFIMLSGMPFNIEATPSTVHLGSVYFVNAGQSIIFLGLQGLENDNKAYLWIKTGSSTSREYPNASFVSNTLQITGSFTYQTLA